MTTNNPALGTDAGWPKPTIPEHQRHNHEKTDSGLIRMEGLICAIEVLTNDMGPVIRCSDKEWTALTAVADLLATQVEEVWRLRRLEWVGLGGSTQGLAEADVAKARGDVSASDAKTGKATEEAK
ncbi:MAG: hypothetical protein LCH69_10065 [Proteobacteria bacterium]|nr:hypothetical protein [Pseudomonadota bacterium]